MVSGAFASLLASGAKLCDQVMLLNARDKDEDGATERGRSLKTLHRDKPESTG
jgi:hypothetical protein